MNQEQEQRLWHYISNVTDLEIFTPSLANNNPDLRTCTFSQLQDGIRRRNQNPNHHLEVIHFHRGTSRDPNAPLPPEQELAMLGRICQPLLRTGREFHPVEMFFEGLTAGWTDESISLVLRNMNLTDLPRDKTPPLTIYWAEGQQKQSMTETIALVLNSFVLPVLSLNCVRLGKEDCRTISQSRVRLHNFKHCSVPCYEDFVTLMPRFPDTDVVANGAFWCCTPEDDTIPPLEVIQDKNWNFYSVFSVLWNRNADKKKDLRLFETAQAFHAYFQPLHQAGLSNLLLLTGEQGQQQQQPPRPTDRPREWIDMLAHDRVRDRFDLLFHLLTLKPELYATEALNRLLRS